MADPPVLRWLHADPALVSAMDAAAKRATSGSWSGATDGELRAFFVRALAAAALVGGERPHANAKDASTLVVNVRPSPRTDDAQWQTGILRALSALVLGADRKASSFAFEGRRTAYTVASDPGLSQPVSAAFPWSAAAAVIGVAGVVATLIYGLVSQQNEIEFTKITTDHKRQELATTLATTVDVIENHKKRELEAGQSLQYDEAELRVLEALERTTGELTRWEPPKPSTLPPVQKVGEKIGESVAGAVNTVGTGIGIAVPLVALFGIYMLTR